MVVVVPLLWLWLCFFCGCAFVVVVIASWLWLCLCCGCAFVDVDAVDAKMKMAL